MPGYEWLTRIWSLICLGCERMDLEWTVDVRFGAHNGFKSAVGPCPKGAEADIRTLSD